MGISFSVDTSSVEAPSKVAARLNAQLANESEADQQAKMEAKAKALARAKEKAEMAAAKAAAEAEEVAAKRKSKADAEGAIMAESKAREEAYAKAMKEAEDAMKAAEAKEVAAATTPGASSTAKKKRKKMVKPGEDKTNLEEWLALSSGRVSPTPRKKGPGGPTGPDLPMKAFAVFAACVKGTGAAKTAVTEGRSVKEVMDSAVETAGTAFETAITKCLAEQENAKALAEVEAEEQAIREAEEIVAQGGAPAPRTPIRTRISTGHHSGAPAVSLAST